MNKKIRKQEVLGLVRNDRAELAHSLLLNLEGMTEDELRNKWLQVAANRAAALDCGKVKTIPYEQVLEDAKVLLHQN